MSEVLEQLDMEEMADPSVNGQAWSVLHFNQWCKRPGHQLNMSAPVNDGVVAVLSLPKEHCISYNSPRNRGKRLMYVARRRIIACTVSDVAGEPGEFSSKVGQVHKSRCAVSAESTRSDLKPRDCQFV